MKGKEMTKQVPSALRALALLTVVRQIGFRRGRRLLALAATGYVGERRRRLNHSRRAR